MPEGEEGRIQWGTPDPTFQGPGSWEMGGPEGERIWRPDPVAYTHGQQVTDTAGNVFTYNAGQVGGSNHGEGAGFQYQSPAALAAAQQAAKAGPSTMYDFGKYGYTTDVNGLPTLAADTFEQGLNNPWLAKMYNTADKGSWYSGIGALTGDYQNLGALRLQGGNYNGADMTQSDATYADLAKFMGIDTGQADWQKQVDQQANNYMMVKGMGGYNAADPRQVNQILYKRQEDGQWKPVLNRAYHEREKGSWWSEGGKMIMVPLGVIGAGLAAGAMAGAGAAEGSAAATAAAEGGAGAAEAASVGGSTLANSSGAWGSGFGLYGEGGMTAAQAAAASEAAGITGTSGALGMGAYGSGSLGSGYLGTAGTGSLGQGMAGGATNLDTGLTFWDKVTNKLQDKATQEAIKKGLGQLSGGGQTGSAGGLAGGSGSSGNSALDAAGGLGGGLGHAAAQEKRWLETAMAPILAAQRRKELVADLRKRQARGEDLA